MNANKTMVIIGGAGHLAGADMLTRVVDKLNQRGAVQDADYPNIICENVTFVDPMSGNKSDATGEGLEHLGESLYTLKQRHPNLDVSVTACCTSYALRKDDPVFASAVKKVTTSVVQQEKPKLLVLQSAASQRLRLYNEVLDAAREAGKEVIVVDAQSCTDIIEYILKHGRHSVPAALGTLLQLLIEQHEIFQDNTRVLLGCTELCLGLGETCDDFINMADELAEAAVSHIIAE